MISTPPLRRAPTAAVGVRPPARLLSTRASRLGDHSPSDRSPALAVVLFFALFTVQMVALLALSPRLFWVDDASTQYSPAMWWLGQHRHNLVPPLMNPELGGASSFAVDMQYGVLDPLHWMWDVIAARFSDLAALSALYGCACLFVVGSGVLVQLLLRRVPPVLAASVAVGVSTSGFLLWFGSDWWPLMWSAGWICWIWNGLQMSSWRGLIITGFSTAAFFAAGYPYFLVFAAGLIALHFLEVVRSNRSVRVLIDRRRLLQYVALGGGIVYALPTLLTMLQSLPLTTRPVPDPLLGNTGWAVPNLLDVVLGSPTLLGDTGFPSPGLWTITYSFVVTLPLVAIIRWDRFLHVPGALVATCTAGLGMVLTQLPAVVLGFRHPFLYMTVVEIFLPIALVLLAVHARRVTRRRVLLAALIVVAQVLLTIARAPNFVLWSGVALVVIGTALTALLLYLASTRGRIVAAAVLAGLSITPALLALGTLVAVQRAQDVLAGAPPAAGVDVQPLRLQPGWSVDPANVRSFAERSIAPGSSASVYDFRDQDIDGGFASGSFAGNQNLFANASLGYGYNVAVTQSDRAIHECRAHFGAACEPDALLAPAPAPAQHRRWIDVLSQPIVLVNSGAPANVVNYLRDNWNEVSAPSGWLRFERRDPLPGRITFSTGVHIARTGWQTDLGRIGTSMEHYTVSTTAHGGSLIFYTTSWPGLEATVDGHSVSTSSLDGSVLKIDLPAGLAGARLDVTYAPIGSKLILLTVVGPALVLLAALGWCLSTGATPASLREAMRRRRSRTAVGGGDR